MVLKTCSRCGRGAPTSPCLPCKRKSERAREKERRQIRGSTTERGLGHRHRQLGDEQLRREPRCYYCGSTEQLERDHAIPRSRGGRSEPGNYRTACAPCNRSRGNRDAPRARS